MGFEKDIRIRKREAFKRVWSRLIAIHIDDAIVDEFIREMEGA